MNADDLFPAAPEIRKPVTIQEMCACITREIKYRERVYARLIDQNKMTREKADKEIRNMRAVEKYLDIVCSENPDMRVVVEEN